MNIRIGFPVDAGCQELSFIVLTKLICGHSHTCAGGRSSGLRENSGAAYVFSQAPWHIQQKYRYEFTPIPMPNAKTSPSNLSDVGYSDAGACALAIEQYLRGCNAHVSTPLVLISCAFVGSNNIIEKVTPDNYTQACESLKNKWYTCCQNKATALFLHEEDASLLQKIQKITAISLTDFNLQSIPENTPILVSCKPHQWKLLISKLHNRKNCGLLFFVGLIFAILGILVSTYFLSRENTFQHHIKTFAQTITFNDVYKEGQGDYVLRVKNYLQQQSIDLSQHKGTLLQSLKDQNWKIRLAAVCMIGEMQQPFAQRELLAMLEKDIHTGFAVSRLLSKWHLNISEVLPILNNVNSHNKQSAIFLLQNTTVPSNVTTYKILQKYLVDKDRQIAFAIINTLNRFSEWPDFLIPEFINQLDSSISIRNTAIEILALAKNSVPYILRKLQNVSNLEKRKELFEILELKTSNELNTSQVIQLILHSIVTDKGKIVRLKKRILFKIPNIFPVLLQKLEEPCHHSIKQVIWDMFQNINHKIPITTSSAIQQLSKTNQNIYIILAILNSLEKIEDKNLISTIFFLCKNSSEISVRKRAILCLANVKKFSLEIIDYTWKLLQTPDIYHREIINIWQRYSSPSLLQKIITKLPNSTKQQKIIMIHALGILKAKKAIPILKKIRLESNNYIRAIITEALMQIDKSQVDINLLLQTAEQTNEIHTQIVYITIFHNFIVEQSVPLLRKMCDHKNNLIKARSFIALFNITQEVSYLLQGLNHEQKIIREKVASEITQIGNKGLVFITHMQKLLYQPTPFLERLLQNNNYSILDAKNLLLSNNINVKLLGIKALAKFSDQSLVEIRKLLQRDKRSEITLEIALVLEKMATNSSRKLLREISLENLPLTVRIKIRQSRF